MRKITATKIRLCRLCDSKKIIKLFNLVPTPPANSYINKKNLKKKIIKYRLSTYLCQECGHMQLGDLVDRKKIFSNYLYKTNTGRQNFNHFKKYANKIDNLFLDRNKKYKILDIASNDGTFLNFFNKKKFLRIGIDPAKNLKKIVEKKKIIQIDNFFTKKNSYIIKKKYGKFDAITANHVCAHLENLNDFFIGVKNILSNDGIFVFEVSYRLEIIKNKLFDTIYHEHIDFHCLKPIIKFVKKFDFELFDFDLVDAQGGSIRFYLCHQNSKNSRNVKYEKILNQIKIEERYKLFINKTYLDFYKKITKIKNKLKLILEGFQKKKLKIAGYGAPAKATTFTYFFQLNKKIVKYIVDDSSLKQDKFTPGKKIPIVSSKFLSQNTPDIMIILAWNYYVEILKKNKKFKNKIKFLLPFPKIRFF